MASTQEPKLSAPEGYKWLPVVSESCSGCGVCVTACPHNCLEMVWDFAKLTRPEVCAGEGACKEVCPNDVIEMRWTEMSGDQKVGRWRDDAPEPLPRRSGWSALVQWCRSLLD